MKNEINEPIKKIENAKSGGFAQLGFESLIGKDVLYANQILLDEGFENKKSSRNLYSILDRNKWFYGVPYNTISITPDENKMVISIIIHFNSIIDLSFYDAFVLDYGNPESIQVFDGYDSIGEWTKDDPNQRVRKTTYKLKEGKFEDEPLFMFWNKNGYQIKSLTKHKQNLSLISFSIVPR